MEFPIFNTKELSDGKTYDLSDNIQRLAYFKAKCGKQIEDLKTYLDSNSFVGYMVSKKGSGKGTYSKMVQELLGNNRVVTIAAGDIIRDVHKNILTENGKNDLVNYLNKKYRGTLSIDGFINDILNRSQEKLMSTEVVLTLVKREIEKLDRRAIFVDGIPRDVDQVSFSLFFRDLINYRDDPDFFVMVDVPESVINERMKKRVICPLCNNTRNVRLLPTKFVEKVGDDYILLCDNSACEGFGKKHMIAKDGDKLGITPIRDRLNKEQKVLELVDSLTGIPKIKLRNAFPKGNGLTYAEDYEVTKEFSYEKTGSDIKILEKPWVVKDDDKIDSYSLMPPPVVVSFIMQLHQILGL